ncbi:MAG: hypothetical protein GSR79_04815 [Desulfurococcales archaeon]|nr:hypothetical protein [Desulfurococcales archaeon]
MAINVLKSWVNELGVANKTVVLKKPSKRVALVLSSITCRNIKLKYRKNTVIYDNYLNLIKFLEECKCEYEVAGNPCDADIVIAREISRSKICKKPQLIIVGKPPSSFDYNKIDIVSLTRTVVPGQYIIEINNVKFLVKLSKCSIDPVVLSDEEKRLLHQIRRSLKENGYLDQETVLLIIASFYNIGRSQARHIVHKMAEKGLLILTKNYIEIPHFD